MQLELKTEGVGVHDISGRVTAGHQIFSMFTNTYGTSS